MNMGTGRGGLESGAEAAASGLQVLGLGRQVRMAGLKMAWVYN